MKSIPCLVLLLFLGPSTIAQTTPPPNIVYILADDLGYFDLGCYGNPYNETPHLDSLARHGLRFTQAYSASPVCSPSRAAILTGRHPARYGLTNFIAGNRTDDASPVDPAPWNPFLPSSATTLAEWLKPQGYTTGMVGKWHLGNGDSLAPWAQGFDYSRMIGRNGLDYYNYSIFEDSYKQEFRDDGTHYLTDKLTDYAVEFLEKQPADGQKPFFLYLAYSAPHVFIVPRGDKLSKYFRKYEKFEGRYNPNYGAMMESLDDGVGRIMAALREQGLLENTLVIFTSDNGGVGLPELGPIPTNMEPLRKWKGHVYEGGIRIPAIAFWKGKIVPGGISDQYFSNVDYFATFSELLQKPMPQVEMDSRSILPVLLGTQKSLPDQPAYWHYPHFSNQLGMPAGAYRLGDYKLTESYEDGATELYNLKNDLSETHDLSTQLPEKKREMLAQFRDWRKKVNANMPVKK
ncbi:sulfatase [Persicitalea jodogahamensis]|uniref:Sulfatase n=1 Tax=Persicitalea jodogahamensis TaxID=402147 RepID=A0A8J3GC97_9BACT|nr:sulfatase [Persicitalea jodogahamensis]GHB83233.1 sulfatase [Persicitalea jodogahamensis]